MRFSGKTALVTGAAGGIGQAIVTGLRAEGARVAAADRDTSTILADAHLDGDLLNPEYCDGLIAAGPAGRVQNPAACWHTAGWPCLRRCTAA